jgi:hypothetical protein
MFPCSGSAGFGVSRKPLFYWLAGLTALQGWFFLLLPGF